MWTWAWIHTSGPWGTRWSHDMQKSPIVAQSVHPQAKHFSLWHTSKPSNYQYQENLAWPNVEVLVGGLQEKISSFIYMETAYVVSEGQKNDPNFFEAVTFGITKNAFHFNIMIYITALFCLLFFTSQTVTILFYWINDHFVKWYVLWMIEAK